MPPDDSLARLSRTLRHASLREVSGLERSLIFLATTGNITPFIGLFGTVWGIMDAFHGIGTTGSANLGAVAPGIAEALITTAAGLAVAIPGVIAYNYFLNRIKGAATRMDLFGLEFLGTAERIIHRAGRSLRIARRRRGLRSPWRPSPSKSGEKRGSDPPWPKSISRPSWT